MAYLPPFFLLLALIFFASPAFSDSSKFWSNNVGNDMPSAISSKLSPLTQFQTFSYAMATSSPNFQVDAKFCSLAKLACTPSIDIFQPEAEFYKGYNADQAVKTVEITDPFLFFRQSLLKEGNTIHLSDLKASLPNRSFLPLQIADKISLTSQGITKVFPNSPMKAIHHTLSYCNSPSIMGETQACTKSLEEMVGFSKTIIGDNKLLALTSKSTKGSGTLVTIKKIQEFNAEKIVACHELFLPFAVYFCHSLPSTNIYSVELVEPRTGAPVNTAVAVCHMDTSSWPANHVSFNILKFGPGQGEACHWFNELDLAWITASGN